MYRFSVTQEMMTRILAEWDLNDTRINVVALSYMDSDTRRGLLDVSIVIGYVNPGNRLGGSNSEEYNPIETNEWQNCTFRQALDELDVQYCTTRVIQIFNWGVGGVSSNVCNVSLLPLFSLIKEGVKVRNYISGEPTYILPLVPVECVDSRTKYKTEAVSLVIEPEQSQLAEAIRILGDMRFSSHSKTGKNADRN
jgi:hypothetical protein